MSKTEEIVAIAETFTTEEEFAEAMIAFVRRAKKTIGDEKTIGFLFGVAMSEVLIKGGNRADCIAMVEATWENFKKAKGDG